MHYTQLYDWSLQIVCAILQISGWPDNGKQAAQLICNWIEFAIGKNLKMLLKTSLFLRGRHCFVLCLRIVFSAKQCKLNFFSLKSVSLHSACIQLRVLYGETLTDYTPNLFCDPWKQSFCIYSIVFVSTLSSCLHISKDHFVQHFFKNSIRFKRSCSS